MKKLSFIPNMREKSELEGLKYWIEEVNFLKVRGYSEAEILKADASVKFCFGELDRLSVPFWVQNAVIVFAKKPEPKAYFSDFLKTLENYA